MDSVLRRWTIWNTLFLMFWIAAHSACPARSPRWSASRCRCRCNCSLHLAAACPPVLQPGHLSPGPTFCCHVTTLWAPPPAGRHINRPDAAIMDGPLWLHWPKLGLWLLLESILLALTIKVKEPGSTFQWDPAITNCREQAWSCEFSSERTCCPRCLPARLPARLPASQPSSSQSARCPPLPPCACCSLCHRAAGLEHGLPGGLLSVLRTLHRPCHEQPQAPAIQQHAHGKPDRAPAGAATNPGGWRAQRRPACSRSVGLCSLACCPRCAAPAVLPSLQIRLRTPPIIFFVLCAITYSFGEPGSSAGSQPASAVRPPCSTRPA